MAFIWKPSDLLWGQTWNPWRHWSLRFPHVKWHCLWFIIWGGRCVDLAPHAPMIISGSEPIEEPCQVPLQTYLYKPGESLYMGLKDSPRKTRIAWQSHSPPKHDELRARVKYFCNINNLGILSFLALFTLGEVGVQWLRLRNSRSKIYGACLRCFVKCFLRPRCPGNPEIPVEPRKPISLKNLPSGNHSSASTFRSLGWSLLNSLLKALAHELTSGPMHRACEGFGVRECLYTWHSWALLFLHVG